MDGNITLSCKAIHTARGFIYPAPPDVPYEYILMKDCEKAWYTQDRTLLADGDGTLNQRLHPLVAGVQPGNLTTRECLNGIHYKMTCSESRFQYEATYNVFSEIIEDKSSAHLHWLWLLLVIILLAGCVWYLLRRRRRGWMGVPQVLNGRAEEADECVVSMSQQ